MSAAGLTAAIILSACSVYRGAVVLKRATDLEERAERVESEILEELPELIPLLLMRALSGDLTENTEINALGNRMSESAERMNSIAKQLSALKLQYEGKAIDSEGYREFNRLMDELESELEFMESGHERMKAYLTSGE